MPLSPWMGSTYWRRSRARSAVFLLVATPAVVLQPADQVPKPTPVSGTVRPWAAGVTCRHAASDRPAEMAAADQAKMAPRHRPGMPADGAAVRGVAAGAVMAVAPALGVAVVPPPAVVVAMAAVLVFVVGLVLVLVLVARLVRGGREQRWQQPWRRGEVGREPLRRWLRPGRTRLRLLRLRGLRSRLGLRRGQARLRGGLAQFRGRPGYRFRAGCRLDTADRCRQRGWRLDDRDRSRQWGRRRRWRLPLGRACGRCCPGRGRARELLSEPRPPRRDQLLASARSREVRASARGTAAGRSRRSQSGELRRAYASQLLRRPRLRFASTRRRRPLVEAAGAAQQNDGAEGACEGHPEGDHGGDEGLAVTHASVSVGTTSAAPAQSWPRSRHRKARVAANSALEAKRERFSITLSRNERGSLTA
jgi:hypothetical protein